MIALIKHLVERGHLDERELEPLLNDLLRDCSSRHAPTKRLFIYQLLQQALSLFQSSFPESTLQVFLNGIKWEKDPECIMVLFDVIAKASLHAPFVEELFEAAFRYFPITYKTPPNKTVAIKTEDLKDALHNVLSMNVFVESLDSKTC